MQNMLVLRYMHSMYSLVEPFSNTYVKFSRGPVCDAVQGGSNSRIWMKCKSVTILTKAAESSTVVRSMKL